MTSESHKSIGRRVGAAIKALRERAGILSSELADASGVDRPHLSRIEGGHIHNPSVGVVDALAMSLNTSVDGLLRPDRPQLRFVVCEDLSIKIDVLRPFSLRPGQVFAAKLIYDPASGAHYSEEEAKMRAALESVGVESVGKMSSDDIATLINSVR